MYSRVKAFIMKHDILCPSQYSFRENYSTEHALVASILLTKYNQISKLLFVWFIYRLKEGHCPKNRAVSVSKIQSYF